MTTMPLRITGGVDTHLDVHVVAALDERGALLGVESFDTTRAGYRAALDWLGSFGQVELVGVEGTGSYGAGLTRHLHAEGVAVVEVDRPKPATATSKPCGCCVSCAGAPERNAPALSTRCAASSPLRLTRSATSCGI